MTSPEDPKIFRTLRDDMRRGDFTSTVRRDWTELRELLLEEQRRERLAAMSPLRRWFVTGWWLLKALFFRLTPARRLLLALGAALIIVSRVQVNVDNVRLSGDTNSVGILLVLFVLGLELKDKLLAKEELDAGRAIQTALLCERSPQVAGWDLWLFTRPANEVGGDLVDFIPLESGRFGVALADVSGKGLSAALLATRLQATLKAIATDSRSLQTLAGKLNVIFCRDCIPGMFASLVYLEGTGNSELRFINAGHIPPLICRKGSIVVTEKGGPALGLMSAGVFAEMSVHLDAGDFVLVYSDGLSEARNPAGITFDDQKLLGLVKEMPAGTAQKTGETILAAVDRFVGDARVHDDLSIAIIRKL